MQQRRKTKEEERTVPFIPTSIWFCCNPQCWKVWICISDLQQMIVSPLWTSKEANSWTEKSLTKFSTVATGTDGAIFRRNLQDLYKYLAFDFTFCFGFETQLPMNVTNFHKTQRQITPSSYQIPKLQLIRIQIKKASAYK